MKCQFTKFRLTVISFLIVILGVFFMLSIRMNKTNVGEPAKYPKPESEIAIRERELVEKKDIRKTELSPSPESPVFPDAACNGLVDADFQLYRKLVNEFETKGALASVVVIVVDGDGNPVPSANVRVFFMRPGGKGDYSVKSGMTGADGRFRSQGLSCWDVVWNVEKQGYYSYSSNLLLRPFLSASGKNAGHWFRSPYSVQAVLEKQETPHEMVFRNVKLPLPPPGETVGFDCLEGIPTPPHGTGKHADVEFSAVFDPDEWKPRSVQDRESVVRISFPGNGDGGMLTPVDEFSELHSPRLSPDDGYSGLLESTIRVVGGKYSKRDMIQPDQYILFRIRSELLPDGSTTNGLFGKMRGDWYVNGPKRLLGFRIWTNEEPGNRNLEDTSGWW